MKAVSDCVLATIRTHRMIPDGGRVLVALSGGPDSVALTLLLRELEQLGSFTVAGVAHLNHWVRADADADEAFCRNLAAQLGIEFRSERVDVPALAKAEGRSLEDAGRRARYAFFERVRAELRADLIATGHTRNDQAETFLLRLIRGAGPRGLGGIYPVTGVVIRPLIDVRREGVLEWLASRNQPYCGDVTNADVGIPRNRVRHELLPLLERRFSPGIVEVLAREADIARADHDYLEKLAIESANLIVLRNSGGERTPLSSLPSPADIVAVELDAAGVAALPHAVAARLARLALAVLAPDRFVSSEHVEAVVSLASGEGVSVSLPGQQASRRGPVVVLEPALARSGARPFRPFENSFAVSLSIPGEVVLASQGWAISAHLETGRQLGLSPGPGALSAEVQAGTLAGPLGVRSRRPGDWLRPAGLGGRRKKLQDLLVDRRIPRETRDFLPLVVDGQGRIVWVVGLAVAEDFRVTEPSQGVILLKARRLGGPG
jgi:tRNA(Ile)-lysidine synthase